MFWKVIQVLFFMMAMSTVIIGVYGMIKFVPFKALKIMKNGYKEERLAIGKRTCFLGDGESTTDSVYTLEYMYTVKGTPYFVTYQLKAEEVDANNNINNNPTRLNPFAYKILGFFYEKDNPANAYAKFELLCPRYCVKRVKTPKDNPARNINREWEDPIFKNK